MKKRYIGIAGLGLVLALGTQQVHAQQGFGTDKPEKSAAVDIQSSKRGLLIPRVTLTSTVDNTTIVSPAQSLMVYNQATTTKNAATDVTPGYYYWDTNRWVRFAQQGDISAINLTGDVTGPTNATVVGAIQGIEVSNENPTANQVLTFVPGEGTVPDKWVPRTATAPWNVQRSDTKATANTQDIYQQGKVGIGFTKDDAVATKTLEIKGDFKTEGKLGNTNQYSGLVTNESFGNISLGVLYASKAPFTSYENLVVQDESTSVMTTPGGTNIVSNGVEHQASAKVNASNTVYSVQMIGQRRATATDGQATSMFWMNPDQTLLKQTNDLSITEVFIDASKGVTFSFNEGSTDLGSYTFPKTNGNANQVLTSTGQPPAGSTAPLVWKSVTDLITPGTAGQVLTTTNDGSTSKVEWKDPAEQKITTVSQGTGVKVTPTTPVGSNTTDYKVAINTDGGQPGDVLTVVDGGTTPGENKVEWKTPATHENIYTHDGTLVGSNNHNRIVDFGTFNSLMFKKGNQSHDFTYDPVHTGLNMSGEEISSIGLLTTSEINGSESILKLKHTDDESSIQTNAANGLKIVAENGKDIKFSTSGFTENNDNVIFQGDGGVQVKKINTLEFKGAQTDKVVVADATGVLKTVERKKMAPQFFYMPAVIFNTKTAGTNLTRDLYQDYVNQFTTVTGTEYNIAHGANGGSLAYDGGVIGSTGAPAAMEVYGRGELHYYVTYYDKNVFANISINANGELKYDIIGTATPASYMNIVFVIK